MYNTREDLETLTVSELRGICRDRGITGMSKQRKDDIIDVLLDAGEGRQAGGLEGEFQYNDKTDILTVFVSCGASSKKLEVAGCTVESVISRVKGIFNFSDDQDLNFLINGKKSTDTDYILKANDYLEFVKKGGSKGN